MKETQEDTYDYLFDEDILGDTDIQESCTLNKLTQEEISYKPTYTDGSVSEEIDKIKRPKRLSLLGRLFNSKKKAIKSDINIKELLNSYSERGMSLVITGHKCSGKTTIAYNLANIISNMGYTVLLVDLDTKGRGLSAITSQNYETIHTYNTQAMNVKKALGDKFGNIGNYIGVVTPTLHLLGTGLAADIVNLNGDKNQDSLIKCIDMLKTHYNIIIFDAPLEVLIEYTPGILYTSEQLLIASEYSNYGALATMIDFCNIGDEDIVDTIFNRGKVCLTKADSDVTYSIMGKASKTKLDYFRNIDKELQSLLGITPPIKFENLKFCGAIPYDKRNDNYWYSSYSLSDTPEGKELYLYILKNVLTKEKNRIGGGI